MFPVPASKAYDIPRRHLSLYPRLNLYPLRALRNPAVPPHHYYQVLPPTDPKLDLLAPNQHVHLSPGFPGTRADSISRSLSSLSRTRPRSTGHFSSRSGSRATSASRSRSSRSHSSRPHSSQSYSRSHSSRPHSPRSHSRPHSSHSHRSHSRSHSSRPHSPHPRPHSSHSHSSRSHSSRPHSHRSHPQSHSHRSHSHSSRHSRAPSAASTASRSSTSSRTPTCSSRCSRCTRENLTPHEIKAHQEHLARRDAYVKTYMDKQGSLPMPTMWSGASVLGPAPFDGIGAAGATSASGGGLSSAASTAGSTAGCTTAGPTPVAAPGSYTSRSSRHASSRPPSIRPGLPDHASFPRTDVYAPPLRPTGWLGNLARIPILGCLLEPLVVKRERAEQEWRKPGGVVIGGGVVGGGNQGEVPKILVQRPTGEVQRPAGEGEERGRKMEVGNPGSGRGGG
ncbi:hypothetical protein EJ06DRAFT_562815 [Trichodelitschia bisporula]|uniref:Uncharacterized protein n=1 Tax=Trichodelitschia bisporula TaxID=703511 RepID=A0A6G1HUE3_9PEZI|nr:hypothetical protein EJ06DRAFT_562815 [Trichodelitschia bisporula]